MGALRHSQEKLLHCFLEAQAASLDFVSLFDEVAGVECFVKDLEGRRLSVSQGIWKRLGFASAREMIGKKDHDLFTPYLADQYTRSDREVISSGCPLVGQLEIWVNEHGVLDWFVVSKYPVFGKDGKVIGIMGTLRTAPRGRGEFAPGSILGRVMEFVREHFHRALSVGELAKVAGLSQRQLRRRFVQDFGVGVAEFVIKTRVQIASDRLFRGGESLSKIALDVGFCDQSAFTRAFRRHLGVTPGEYRRRYLGKSLNAPSSGG
jgi:AraC-like DNA-binding protein